MPSLELIFSFTFSKCNAERADITQLNSSTGLTDPVVNCCAALLAAEIRALYIRVLSSRFLSPGVFVFNPSDPADAMD